MAEFEKYNARGSTIGRILSMSLVRRLLGLAGLALIVTGYGMIMDSSGMANTETVIHRAISGMVLVCVGGVIEVLVLLAWSKR